MQIRDLLLMQLDHAWQDNWECMADALDGLTAEEADWQAPAYADCEAEDGWPPPGTVRWQIAHIAHCKRFYTAMIGARGRSERPPATPRQPLATLADELAALQAAQADHRAAIAALTDDDLELDAPNGKPLVEFIITTTRHDIWHAGQIVVARRLWRMRNA